VARAQEDRTHDGGTSVTPMSVVLLMSATTVPRASAEA
jgi:hypothetical protein